jgi:autotransporter family porin
LRREQADGSRDTLGVTFAVGGADSKVTHTDGTTGNDNFAACRFGGYWTHFGSQGWYRDAVALGTYYDMTSSAVSASGLKRSLHGASCAENHPP